MTLAAAVPETDPLTLADEAATRRAGAALAASALPGDTILLAGDLGAGKSVLARAFIAALLGAEGRSEDIPSPTYTLVNVYETVAGRIWHADLYRLPGGGAEVEEIGLAEAFGTDIVLVEWPDRLGSARPPRCLMLRLAPVAGSEGARLLDMSASGPGWAPALAALAEAAG